MVLVDTNILLNAVNGDSSDHTPCAEALEVLVNDSENWMLSWSIIYEFGRVATHPRVFEKPLTFVQVSDFVHEWVSSDSCSVISESDDHLEILSELQDRVGRLAGNIVHDFHNAVLMYEHGIEDILTLDRDFRTFPWVVVRQLPAL